ncbi:MAG TPA: DnaA regulatory inactivator Hda [Porticoccaceae bacterium]|jgi:DnaA family protein|nr:DnaA regulatory inactivator Hda [Porticoccaceae bacterium]
MTTHQQLSLAITLDDQATFENFYAPNGTPQHMATFLLQDEMRKFAFLSGSSGTGLSHLLQAICQVRVLGKNSEAIYLPLKELFSYSPRDVLDGLESSPMVCVDDFDIVANDNNWQLALFNLFNNCRDKGSRLVIASHQTVDQLNIELADLSSRLKSGVALHLPNFNDADQRRLLQYRCNRRGLYLSDDVAIFLLNRLPRDTHTLMSALDTLDEASLQEQRRLTMPFVKATLSV